MTKRFIRTQGELDGACFLYALANAIQAIRARQISSADWSRMLSKLTNTKDFLDQSCGTQRTDNSVRKQALLANRVVQGLSRQGTLRAESVSPLTRRSALEEIITTQSAIVLSSPQHWYCIVDADSQQLYIACSWILHEHDQKYKERQSPHLRRYYNRVESRGSLRVFQSRGFVVAG